MEVEDENTTKKVKAKQATTETLATITENCDDVLYFLQAVVVKSPQVTVAPLSLHADKSARVWFCRWTDINLPTLPNPASQDHMGFTGVLTDVATSLHTAEALLPVVAAQREVEKETKGWDRIPLTAQRVILAASATNRTSILTSPPPTIHRFLNVRNAAALQTDFSLTYTMNNFYLPTSLCLDLLQGHILDIPDPDAPTGL